MSKDSYVTGNLHRISGQIAEAAKKASDGNPPAVEEASKPSATTELVRIPPPPPARSPEMDSALLRRHEDYLRLKRDVMARLAASLSAIPEEAAHCRKRLDELGAAESKLRGLQKSIEGISEPETGSSLSGAQLAESFKTVENSRLEMIRTVAKTEKGALGRHAERGRGGADSLFHELNSLSFRQLFRFGLYIGLPLALAIAFSGTLVALAILAALRLGV